MVASPMVDGRKKHFANPAKLLKNVHSIEIFSKVVRQLLNSQYAAVADLLARGHSAQVIRRLFRCRAHEAVPRLI
jgi:hypothetical protein